MGRQRNPGCRWRAAGLTGQVPNREHHRTRSRIDDAPQAELGIGRVRRSPRFGRHRSRCRPRRAVGRSRPERCRQDHIVQRGGRRHQANLRLRPDPGCRLHADAVTSPRRASELPAPISALGCSRASRSKTICTWPSSEPRVGIDHCVAHSSTRARERRPVPRPPTCGSAITSTRGWATSPTANNANSKLAWQW